MILIVRSWSLPLTLSYILAVKVSEMRKWEQGCYTLVHDTDTEGLELPLTLSYMLVVRVSEVRKWQQECYTLIQDADCEGLEFDLDLVLYVGCQGD